jgi:hypothetical protein
VYPQRSRPAQPKASAVRKKAPTLRPERRSSSTARRGRRGRRFRGRVRRQCGAAGRR